ncbi:MAG: LuxR family transcriptional regulator, partial [Eggerthella lenta]
MRFILKNMKREQVLAALAYGFFLACTSVTLWGGYVRFLTGQVDPGSFMLEYFVRSATLPLSLAVSGLAAFYWPKARLWRSPILALGFFLAGSLLVALQHGGVVSSEWSLVVVGACFGWGSGI